MSTMTRTDIHRPSAPEFDPENYNCVGVFDLHHEEGDHRERMSTVSRMVDAGYHFTSVHGSDQCGHCGARIRYAALMTHEATKGMIYVGETCLDNRFELTKGEFDTLRKAAALNRERAARISRLDAFLAEHPSLAYLSYAHNIGEAGAEYVTEDDEYWGPETRLVRNTAWSERTRTGAHLSTLQDMWGKIVRYAEMSDKAIDYAERIMGWLDEAETKRAAREAAEQALTESGVQVPAGRIVVEGTVLSTKFVDNQYGGSLKMLVQHESGWKVWGTVPSNIDIEVDKGVKVRFTATVTQTEDSLFGFYSRPVKAEVL